LVSGDAAAPTAGKAKGGGLLWSPLSRSSGEGQQTAIETLAAFRACQAELKAGTPNLSTGGSRGFSETPLDEKNISGSKSWRGTVHMSDKTVWSE